MKIGEFPDEREVLDSVIIGDRVYLVGGLATLENGHGHVSSMYSAKLPLPSMNLYFKGGQCDCRGGVVHTWHGGWIGLAWATGTGCIGQDWIGS